MCWESIVKVEHIYSVSLKVGQCPMDILYNGCILINSVIGTS